MEQAAECAALAEAVHALGGNVWVYTGWRYEALVQESDPARLRLLAAADVLVDGPYVEAERSLELRWRGSRNQRLIDLNATRRNREAYPANGIKKLLQQNRCSSFYVRDSEKL